MAGALNITVKHPEFGTVEFNRLTQRQLETLKQYASLNDLIDKSAKRMSKVSHKRS